MEIRSLRESHDEEEILCCCCCCRVPDVRRTEVLVRRKEGGRRRRGSGIFGTVPYGQELYCRSTLSTSQHKRKTESCEGPDGRDQLRQLQRYEMQAVHLVGYSLLLGFLESGEGREPDGCLEAEPHVS